jgi:hypothetical protein
MRAMLRTASRRFALRHLNWSPQHELMELGTNLA